MKDVKVSMQYIPTGDPEFDDMMRKIGEGGPFQDVDFPCEEQETDAPAFEIGERIVLRGVEFTYTERGFVRSDCVHEFYSEENSE